MNREAGLHAKQPSKLKMSRGFQNPEPLSAICEIVQIGREDVRRCDATLFFKTYGRGEFDIDGGTIFWEQQQSRNRRLTIVTKNGDQIEITRKRRGDYKLHTEGFWIRELDVVEVDI